MSADAAVLVRSWPVGAYVVTMSVPRPVGGLQKAVAIEWSPSEPTRLSGKELDQYRRGRDEAIGDLARELGIRVAVLEI